MHSESLESVSTLKVLTGFWLTHVSRAPRPATHNHSNNMRTHIPPMSPSIHSRLSHLPLPVVEFYNVSASYRDLYVTSCDLVASKKYAVLETTDRICRLCVDCPQSFPYSVFRTHPKVISSCHLPLGPAKLVKYILGACILNPCCHDLRTPHKDHPILPSSVDHSASRDSPGLNCTGTLPTDYLHIAFK